MRTLRLVASLLFVDLLGVAALEAQAVRLESATRSGQGWMGRYGGQCYVITPRHVVDGVSMMHVIAPNGETSPATMERHSSDSRFSVLKLSSRLEYPCRRWPPIRREAIREAFGDGKRPLYLRHMTPNNDVQLMEVGWLEAELPADSVQISIQRSTDKIEGGMSGGQLMSGQMVVGLLERANSTGGVGTVDLLDKIFDDLEDVFPVDPSLQAVLDITTIARLDAPYYGVEGRRVWPAKKGIQPFVAVHFLNAPETRLRGELVNDTAAARVFALVGGGQTILPTPGRFVLSLYAGATVQHESTEAHQLRYVEAVNYGAVFGAGLRVRLGEDYAFTSGIDTQFLQIEPYRQVEVKVIDRTKTPVMLRVGFSYLH